MSLPDTPARLRGPPVDAAMRDAETLAWFGTAYGRRVQKQVPADAPSAPPARLEAPAAEPNVVEFAHTRIIADSARRPFAPFVVLGAVVIALVTLRSVPVASPPALAPVDDPRPKAPPPQLEALQQSAPDAAQLRQDAERLALEASIEAENLAAATLAPLIPLEASSVPLVAARLASDPATAPNPMPEPVAVTEGGLTNAQSVAQSQPVVSANLGTPQKPQAAPSLTHAPDRSGHSDMSAGKAHLANGDLPQARAAFTKAFEKGLPEAALALGNTFDPVSLAKTGVKAKGDPEAARRWYRRAFELAMRGPRRRGY